MAAGLTVIFGVTRIVNFAHGSLFMLGAYIGWSILIRLPRDPAWFACGVILAALATGIIGAMLEVTLLRRVYRAPELFQLLATFGVVLLIQDLTPLIWGPADLPLPRPAWLRGFVLLNGERFPSYDLVLIALGPAVLGALWLLMQRTRFGVLIRAATEDRDMAAALGIDQRLLFTTVFALGSALAGLGGVLALPNTSANPQMDLAVIVEAFVVVVIGGLGSLPGAFLASLLIGELQAFGIVLIPRATLVLVFVVMAAVLIVRPNGLLGQALTPIRGSGEIPALIRPPNRTSRLIAMAAILVAAMAPLVLGPYPMAVLTEALIAMLFAASLHLMMGPGGMPSFGHAAWFGLGAYAAGIAASAWAAPLLVALLSAALVAALAALPIGWFVVRLSGVYLAMLTLAFAQIVWAVASQWTSLTGGDDGILGVWPTGPLPFYGVVLALTAGGVGLLRRVIHAPFGYGLRATRDSALRAAAIGLEASRLRLGAFTMAGAAAGLAGGLFAYAKGSVFPTYVSVGHSVDALLMVLLGGVQTISGPVVGALAYTALYDVLLPAIPMWRLALGMTIIVLVLVFPRGLAGMVRPAARPAPWTAAGGKVGAAPVVSAAFTLADSVTLGGQAGAAHAVAEPSIPVLRVRGLRKAFGGVRAVDGVSFSVFPGEVVALIGANGAGKSTCFNLLNGQTRPDAGQVLLGGQDVTGWPPRRIARLGVGRSFQVAAIFASMTACENVQLALLASRLAVWDFRRRAAWLGREEALSLLASAGIADRADQSGASLAYGDAKRLELAVALAGRPRLLLMDEPTAGTSPADRGRMMALVREIARNRGCGVLFTEHDIDVVFRTADRVLVMDQGALIAAGDPASVRADPAVRAAYLGTSEEGFGQGSGFIA